MLQFDPAAFRIKDWLRDFSWVTDDRLVDRWHIDVHIEELQPGDTVFIWVRARRGTPACILGLGKFVPLPDVFPLADRQAEYFRDQREIERLAGLQQVAVKYSRLCLGAPISKRDLAAHSVFSGFPGTTHGIFRISDAAGKNIERMMRKGAGPGDLVFCGA